MTEKTAKEILLQLDPKYSKCVRCERLFNIQIDENLNNLSGGYQKYDFEPMYCIFCSRFHSVLFWNFKEQKIDNHTLESVYGHLYRVRYDKTITLMYKITKK